MNWVALGVIGQWTGSVAVVATLFYLASQIRHNTRAVKAASHHAITDSFNAVSAQLVGNPAAARIWRIGIVDYTHLELDEQVTFGVLGVEYMRVFETLWYQRQLGTMEDQLFTAEEASLLRVARNAGFREWWREIPYSVCDEFRTYVDGLLREVASAA